jgi:two-component system CheB/CheR fusion protein
MGQKKRVGSKRVLAAGRPGRRARGPSSRAKPDPRAASSGNHRSNGFPVVGIGASAGGLDAFNHLLRALPDDTGMAFVIIQHLDPKHESMLADILSRDTHMPVREVAANMPVEPDHVYVIPPNRMMELSDGTFRLAPRNEANGRHMPVDHFFRSLARTRKERAIGVVLSGTASDGALGIEAIKAEGGITFAQEESSARHHGMPQAAIKTGAVDFVLMPEQIARELARIARHPHVHAAEGSARAPQRAATDASDEIISMLRSATGLDFSHYRQSTIRRRITRRMALSGIDSLEKYVPFLRENPREVRALYDDLLIRVTRFFREPETFEFLEKKIFPRILKKRPSDSAVRLWVPGCATGEEVYSLVISLLESMKALRRDWPLQVYGTDVSESAIEKARAGIYSENATADVSPERLRRFFVKTDGSFQIARSVRDACVFARHNVLADPPFLHLDLLSCRNLLIYIETALQKRILPIFHHALSANGVLVLGTAETIGTFGDLFAPEDRHHKVFSKKPFTSRTLFDYSQAGRLTAGPEAPPQVKRPGVLNAADSLREADRIVLSQFAPAGVVVNESLDVVQFRGRTGPFLEAAPGAASLNVLKMAREGLLVDLRASLQKARKTQARVRREGIRVKRDGGFNEIRLEVVPFAGLDGASHYLVLFEPAAPAPAKVEPAATRDAPAPHGESRRAAKLAEELAATKEYLQAIIEEQESTNEELRSANEEILSSNEELQSTNEELETAKEELQSANEELKTVNDELQDGNARLSRLRDDLTNLLSSVTIPIVMLGTDGKVRRFTPTAERMFHLVPGDLTRSLKEIRPRINVPDLPELIRGAVEEGVTTEREIQDEGGRWYRLQVRPYRAANDGIEGAVLVFLDEDALKRGQEELQKSLTFAEAVIDTVREPLLVLDAELRVVRANRAFFRTFDLAREAVDFRPIYELGEGQWDIPQLRALLGKVIRDNESFQDVQIVQTFNRVGRKMMLLNGRRTTPRGDGGPLILLAIEDDTDRVQTEERLRQAQKLDSVGRLAGGIAHDFNNLLNIISAYASLLADHGSDPNKRKEGLEAIHRSVQRGSALVHQLLTFARKSEVLFGSVSLNAVVSEIVEILRETFPRQIVITTDLDPELLPIRADANQLHQALLNLAVNARDAMPGGGAIRIETARVSGDDLRSRVPEAAAPDYACLRITDEGAGMDEATRSRMFEPFFTTKPPGHGEGLGLAVVHGIVKSHRGFIEVRSERGTGTTVQVSFPIAAPEETSVSPPMAQPATTTGTETILLVEDEEMLREPVKALLEDKGYRVITAADGVEAEEKYTAQAGEIDLVILDMGLPRQGGRETLFRLRRFDPNANILLASGFFDGALRQEMMGAGARAFLRKPYSAEEILQHARAVLDRGKRDGPAEAPAAKRDAGRGERGRKSKERPGPTLQ